MKKLKLISLILIAVTAILFTLALILTAVGISRHGMAGKDFVVTKDFKVNLEYNNQIDSDYYQISGTVKNNTNETQRIRIKITLRASNNSVIECFFEKALTPGENKISYEGTSAVATKTIQKLEILEGNIYVPMLHENEIWHPAIGFVVWGLAAASAAAMLILLNMKASTVIARENLQQDITLQTQIKNIKLAKENEILKTELKEKEESLSVCQFCGSVLDKNKKICPGCGARLKL